MPDACSSGAILETMACIEETIGELYREFTSRYPDLADTWQELAEEERQHAGWLREFNQASEEGVLSLDPSLFNPTLLSYFLDHTKTLLEQARSGRYSAHEALDAATTLEFSVLEHLYYEVVIDRDYSLQEVFKELEEATRRHAERLTALQDRQAP